jgi:hypothetical protein
MSYTTNEVVDWLLSRSYGQGGSVALPNADLPSYTSPVPEGAFPAGINDVLDLLVDQYADWTTPAKPGTKLHWCFLIGGPGNGKSAALKRLANVLQVPLPIKTTGEPAPRVVPISWPNLAAPVVAGLEIAFINDASIPHPSPNSGIKIGSLFLDLREGLERLFSKRTPVVLFGNINRGILIEEHNALTGNFTTSAERAAANIIEWLNNPTLDGGQDPAGFQTTVYLEPGKSFYSQFEISLVNQGAAHDIIVHVVFLDTLSLLEPTPALPSGRTIDFSSNPPNVAPYRPLGGFSNNTLSRDTTTAGKFIASIVEPTKWEMGNCISHDNGKICEAFNNCPLVQNAQWLREQVLRERFLDTLRAAEITAARRLTYRDLLGHASLAILGQAEPSWLEGQHPCNWVVDKLSNNHKENIVDLVSHRIYFNLFPTPDLVAWKQAKASNVRLDTIYKGAVRRMTGESEPHRVSAFEQAFNSIDPARDLEPWDGFRNTTLDIVEALDVELPALQILSLKGISARANSSIEKMLDEVLRSEIVTELTADNAKKVADARVYFLRKWRSTLLLRQVGLATGNFAAKNALASWLAEQENALVGGSPLELGKGLQALILATTTNRKFLVAPLRPRTYSLSGEAPPNTLLVELSAVDLRVEIVPRGDTLVAEVQVIASKKVPETVASIVIDLAVAREALLHSDGDNFSFTEIGASAFARIERARASLISRARMKNSTVYFTDELGKRYRLAPNAPGGTAPLRIVPL